MSTALLMVAGALVIICFPADFGFVVLAAAVTSGLGLYELVKQDALSNSLLWIYLGGNLAVVTGFYLTSVATRAAKQRSIPDTQMDGLRSEIDFENGSSQRGNKLDCLPRAGLIVILIAAYHLGRAGIPILSANTEISRFDFTSSGFFGIPGRIYLFGVPIMWILITARAVYRADHIWQSRTWVLYSIAYVVISVLGGLKSGLIALVIIAVIILPALTGRRVRVGTMIRRWWYLFIIGASYAAFIAVRLYPTYRDQGNVVDALMTRLTTGSAEPKVSVLTASVTPPPGGFWGQFSYYFMKYSGGDVSGRYVLERAVSAKIYGADPSSDSWTTPVTVGGVAEMVYWAGPILGILLLLAFGCLAGYLDGSARQSPRKGAANATILYCFYLWLSRGNLPYYLINFVIVSGFVLFIVGVSYYSEKLLAPAEPTERRPGGRVQT
ncbi:hypothetical protein [Acidipropionibacterium jensenii]|uniref:hypothetical protein n=1 Tax=Acidipropionibacterium jensenii TaxID=1749 RepID=UPI000BC33671|nr:hypothetical protein [Acidipropionibacterium jensenii]